MSKGVVERCSVLGGMSRMWGGWIGEEEEGGMRRKGRLERYKTHIHTGHCDGSRGAVLTIMLKSCRT